MPHGDYFETDDDNHIQYSCCSVACDRGICKRFWTGGPGRAIRIPEETRPASGSPAHRYCKYPGRLSTYRGVLFRASTTIRKRVAGLCDEAQGVREESLLRFVFDVRQHQLFSGGRDPIAQSGQATCRRPGCADATTGENVRTHGQRLGVVRLGAVAASGLGGELPIRGESLGISEP